MKNILLPALLTLLPTFLPAQQNLYEALWREMAKESFKSKYKIKRDENGFVAAINDKAVHGTDGELPGTVIQNVQIIIDKDTLRLPPSAYANLFEPNLYGLGDSTELVSPLIYVSNDKRRIYIYSQHSDAAGAYEVTWIIQDRKYLRRVVDGTN